MARNTTWFVWMGAAALFAAALLVSAFFLKGGSERYISPERSLTLRGITLAVAVADTPQERDHGLSGTTKLADGEGMLFIFERDGQHSFWMKDMHYPIDIMWISAGKQVVYLEENVVPDTFPQSLTPPMNARYVLEVPAGFSRTHGVVPGTEVSF